MHDPPQYTMVHTAAVLCDHGKHVTILQEQIMTYSCLQVCGLSALYCCYTVDDKPVSTEIPSKWPPNAAPIPAGLSTDSLDCASGNCTEESLPPAAVPPAFPEGEVLSSWYIGIVKLLQKLPAARLSFWHASEAWSTPLQVLSGTRNVITDNAWKGRSCTFHACQETYAAPLRE